MANYKIEDIRNIVLLGHAGAGKTTLAEAMLHTSGATNRLGSVDDKSSIFDSDDEEHERGHSIDSGIGHVEHKGKVINVIDTPGYPDFTGAALAALMGAETAVVVISAAAGIQMNTRKMLQAARDRGMALAIVINKIDSSMDEVPALMDAIQESFGMECRCVNLAGADGKSVIDCLNQDSGAGAYTDVAEAHTNLLETVIEADETLMEAYLSGEDVSPEKVASTFGKALIAQTVIPVFFTSARHELGVKELLDVIADTCPSPVTGVKALLVSGEGEEKTEEEINPDDSGPVLGLVIRVSADPKSHIKYSTVRLFSGTIKSDTTVNVADAKKGMRCGHVNKLQGDQLEQIDDGVAGDIVTLAKLDDLRILNTVYAGNDPGKVKTVPVPVPMFSLAVEAKSRGDETKISAALHEFCDSDPTFTVVQDRQTHEMVMSGIGELHTRVILARMQGRRGIEVTTKPPTIPYRETIIGSAKMVEYTHKKQSGGAGQFGRVFIDLEPNESGAGYEFLDKIFGGSIDQPFRPSVDKGCQAAMHEGVLAGFPVVDVKVSLVDGKTHPVDSKDIAFQIAGREAFRKAFMQCKPVLLEPIVNLEVTVPSENVGDITGDLAGRRGRVQGQDVLPGGMTVIKAQVPLSEIQQYNSQLKSVTGGQGSYSMEYSHYEPAPPNVIQAVVAKVKAAKEEDN